jgi:CRISPR/Cas system-associated exonuclease Cas4 (RecB family)
MGDLIKNANFTGLSKAFDTKAMEELLEEASTKTGRESKWTKKRSFAPSSFYSYGNGVCPRYWYYAFNGAEFVYENTARQRANMDSGTAAGERIAGLFEKAGILNGAEFEIKHNDPPIFGYGDLAVTWQGEQMVGEVKTTTTEAFQTRAAKMSAPGYQLLQLLIYMYVLNKDKGFFVTENKNTHELLIVPVKMTEDNKAFVDRSFEWMRMVYKNAQEGELPKRPFTKSSFNCKGCPVKATCWEGFKRGSVNGTDPNPGVVDLPALEVPK